MPSAKYGNIYRNLRNAIESGDYAYQQTLTVVCNFSAQAVTITAPLLKERLREGTILISNIARPEEGETLMPYEGTAWLA